MSEIQNRNPGRRLNR